MASGDIIFRIKDVDAEFFSSSSKYALKDLHDYSIRKKDFYEEIVQMEQNQYHYKLTWKKDPEFTVEGIKESLDGCSLRGVLKVNGLEVYKGRMFTRNSLELYWKKQILEILKKEPVEEDVFSRVMNYSRMLEFNYDTRVISIESPEKKALLEEITVGNSLLPFVPHGYGEYKGQKGFFVNGILFQNGIAGLQFDLEIDKLRYEVKNYITVKRGGNILAQSCNISKGMIAGAICQESNDWTIIRKNPKGKDNAPRFNTEIIAKKNQIQYEGKLVCYEDVQFYGYGKLQIGGVIYEGCFLNNNDMVTCCKTENGKMTLCRIENKKEVIQYKKGRSEQKIERDCYKWAIVKDEGGREWLLVCRYLKEDFKTEEGEVIFYSGYDERRFETGIKTISEIKWIEGKYKERETHFAKAHPDAKTEEVELDEFRSKFPNKIEFLENKHCLTSPEISEVKPSEIPERIPPEIPEVKPSEISEVKPSEISEVKPSEIPERIPPENKDEVQPAMKLNDCTNNTKLFVSGLSPRFKLPEVSMESSYQHQSNNEDPDIQRIFM